MKRLIYFVPSILAFVFYIFLSLEGQFSAIHPSVWICIALLVFAGLFMSYHKWWGSLFGLIVGILLIYMGTKETGQIINEMPIGIVLCCFYVILGIYILRKK